MAIDMCGPGGEACYGFRFEVSCAAEQRPGSPAGEQPPRFRQSGLVMASAAADARRIVESDAGCRLESFHCTGERAVAAETRRSLWHVVNGKASCEGSGA